MRDKIHLQERVDKAYKVEPVPKEDYHGGGRDHHEETLEDHQQVTEA